MQSKSINNKIEVYCPECLSQNSIRFISEKAETVCNQCGLIIEDRIFNTSFNDKRFFDKKQEKERSHYGPFNTNFSFGSNTVIDTSRMKNYNYKKKYERLKKTQRYANSSSCSNYRPAYFQFDRICTNLGISKRVKLAAFKLYVEAQKRNIIKGRSIIGMAIVCLYYVCRQFGYLRLLVDFAPELEGHIEIDGSTKSEEAYLHKCFRVLLNILNLKPLQLNFSQLLVRFNNELNMGDTFVGVVLDFWKAYKKWIPTDGRDPKGIAGAILYYLGKKYQRNITQQRVVDVTNVTEVTIRSRYKEILSVVEEYPSMPNVSINMVGSREKVRSPT